MIRAEVLDALLEAGASAEMIVAAVKAAATAEDAKRDARRAKDAARQRRVRQTRAAAAESRPRRVTPRDGADAPPNEKDLTPLPPRSSDEDLAPLAEKLAVAWNEGPAKAGALPCRSVNPGRRAALRARLREHGEAGLFVAVRNLAASEFHCGRNPRGWKASLGWLLGNAEAFQRMIELTPSAEAARTPMSPAEQIASVERSAALLGRMGRADEAAAMRRTAAKLRQQLEAGDE
jgi:hypothetical protein